MRRVLPMLLFAGLVGHVGDSHADFETDSPPDVTAPEVEVVMPVDGEVFRAPAHFPIQIDAFDDRGVEHVELFIDGDMVGYATSTYVWYASVAPGEYELSALAIDAAGNASTTANVTIRVVHNPIGHNDDVDWNPETGGEGREVPPVVIPFDADAAALDEDPAAGCALGGAPPTWALFVPVIAAVRRRR